MPTQPKLVLATDLDGTFLGGSEDARRALYDWIEASRDIVHLIFVTGRDLPHIGELCQQPGFPTPDHIVGDVGTTVVEGDTHRPVEPVQRPIAERWGDAGERVRAMLAEVPWLEPQEGPFVHRMSYTYDPADLDPGVVRRIEESGFDCITSADYYLDVLPRGVSKGPTLLSLLDHLELPRQRTLVAGDTLNDWSLYETGLPGVVVGNAEPALKERTRGLSHLHHSEHEGAAGIADAMAHLFSITIRNHP